MFKYTESAEVVTRDASQCQTINKYFKALTVVLGYLNLLIKIFCNKKFGVVVLLPPEVPGNVVEVPGNVAEVPGNVAVCLRFYLHSLLNAPPVEACCNVIYKIQRL